MPSGGKEDGALGDATAEALAREAETRKALHHIRLRFSRSRRKELVNQAGLPAKNFGRMYANA